MNANARDPKTITSSTLAEEKATDLADILDRDHTDHLMLIETPGIPIRENANENEDLRASETQEETEKTSTHTFLPQVQELVKTVLHLASVRDLARRLQETAVTSSPTTLALPQDATPPEEMTDHGRL